jgi:hypothetical protein
MLSKTWQSAALRTVLLAHKIPQFLAFVFVVFSVGEVWRHRDVGESGA